MRSHRIKPFWRRRKSNRHRPCPRCSYINQDPRERFCKMCRTDFARRGLGRAKWPLLLCAIALGVYWLARTSALDTPLEALGQATRSVTKRVDTATQMPQHSPVPTVIGPAPSGHQQSLATAASPRPPVPNAQTVSPQEPAPAQASAPAAPQTLASAATVAAGVSETSQEELLDAINTLRTIPPSAPEYENAQGLLQKLEKRLQAARRQEETRKRTTAPGGGGGGGRPSRRSSRPARSAPDQSI